MIQFELAGKFKYNGQSHAYKVTVDSGDIIGAADYMSERMLKKAMQEIIKSGDEELFQELFQANYGKQI